MIIAQISDVHMLAPGVSGPGGYAPAQALAAVLRSVQNLRPSVDLVVLSGDLTENGRPEEYAALREVLAGLAPPILAIPGNHDDRLAFAAGMSGRGIGIGSGEFLHLSVELGPLRLLLLDTLDTGSDGGGLLCEARLDWVAHELAGDARRPTLIFMHHPPFATGIGFMDAIGCRGAAPFAALVESTPQVVGVACGHVHRAVAAGWAGTIGTICPSVAPALALDLSFGGDPRIELRRPGFQIHAWASGGLVTHTEYLAE